MRNVDLLRCVLTAYRNDIIGLGVTTLATALIFKVVFMIHYFNSEALATSAFGVTAGHPDLIAFQNRLLGPYSVLAISKLGISYRRALWVFFASTLLLHNLIFYILLRVMKRSSYEATIWVGFFGIFFLFLHHFSFYPWDTIDLIVFTICSFVIFCGYDVLLLVPLFLIDITNRESALIMPVIMIFDAVTIRFSVPVKCEIKKKKQFLAGICLLAGGLAYVEAARMLLLVSARDASEKFTIFGNFFPLLKNLKDLTIHNWKSLHLIHSVLFLTFFVLLMVDFFATSEARRRAAMFPLIFMVQVLLFCIFNETRVLFPLITMFVFWFLTREDKVLQTCLVRPER